MRLVVLLALVGCVSPGNVNQTHPAGEDPLGLLTTGADGVVDIDVTQLRGWSLSQRILDAVPDVRARLSALPFDALEDVDALWVGLYGIGRAESHSLLILRTDLLPERLVGEGGEVGDHRGFSVWTRGDTSAARVTPKLVALGSTADVRRALDLARSDGASVRGDKALMDAFSRCPTARSGRPALMSAFVLDDRLRDQLRTQDLPGVEMDWLAVSFAVGDGFDVGAIAMMHGEAEAKSLAESAKKQVTDLARKPSARLLGLRPLLDALLVKQRDNEVHFAYRLPGAPIVRLLGRLEALNQAARKK
jgi:hypothetical protein